VALQQRPRAAATGSSGGGGFSQTLPAAPHEPVKVSLHDCLACSGCVTSAETVLLQHQSTGELQQRLADGSGWTVVVSLSPQSVASLAALHCLPAGECAARLATFLRQLGAGAVFDIAAARQLSLAEAAAEFMQRYRASPRGAAALAAAGASAGSGCAAAATATGAAAAAGADGGDAMDVDAPQPQAASSGSSSAVDAGPLPMLASACPGWVCYAEKTHGDHVLPYISTGEAGWGCVGRQGSLAVFWLPEGIRECNSSCCHRCSCALPCLSTCVHATHPTHLTLAALHLPAITHPNLTPGKSPQSVMGTLIKRRWCTSAGLQPDRVYHCAVMPCYDKKLEASREDFWLPGEPCHY